MPDLATSFGGALLSAGSSPTTSGGILLTANASVNSKATTWTELITSLTGAASWLMVGMQPEGNHRVSMDIGIGASTAEQVLIPDLFSENVTSTNQLGVRTYLVPIAVPSGTRISARSQCNTASGQTRICVHAISPRLDSPRPLGRCEAVGFTAASTSITAVDHGGVAHTDSAWTVLIASTSFAYRWLCVAFGHSTSVTGANERYLVDIGVGASTAEVSIIDDLFVRTGTNADSPYTVYNLPVAIPAGTRISARVRSDGITALDRVLDVGAWGVG